MAVFYNSSGRWQTTSAERPLHYQRDNCTFLAAFPPNAHSYYIIDPNPDISGIGVLLAFLISAYSTLLFTIVAYWTGLVPDELLNAVDKNIFGARSERRPGWSEAFREGIRAFSDQQIVTGIAILAAAFAGVRTVSVYHWRTVVYLAWMSSHVHLTTLTVLRRMLQQNSVVRAMRVTGMLVLFALLVVALVPTVSNSFSEAMMNTPWNGLPGNEWATREPNFMPGDPAMCFWQQGYMDGANHDSILSYAMLTSSYAWKIAGLWKNTPQLTRRYFRDKPARVAQRFIRTAGAWRSRSPRAVYWITAWPFSLLVGFYLFYVAVFDTMQSFFFAMLVLTINLGWGTINLVIPRHTLQPFIGPDESEWNFGQYLPMLLLLLPLMSVIEEFSVRKDKVDVVLSPSEATTPVNTGAATGSDTFRLLAHQPSWASLAPPSRAGTQASLPPYSSHGRSIPSTPVTPVERELHLEIGPPSPIVPSSSSSFSPSPAVSGEEPKERAQFDVVEIPAAAAFEMHERAQQEGLLYSSKYFKSLVWLIHISVVAGAAFVFFVQFQNLVNAYVSNQVVTSALDVIQVVLVVMAGWIGLGAMFSKVSR